LEEPQAGTTLMKPKEEAMPAAKYIVELTADEREQLIALQR
jgi:hypothetical protein